MKREVIMTELAPKAVGPYSQAIRAGQFVFTSGQIGLDPATGQLVEAENSDDSVQMQATQVLKNLQAVLEAAGSGFPHVVKCTVYLRYIKDFATVNEVYAQFFGENPPARSTFAVAALPLGALVEIEAVALVPAAEEESAAEEEEDEEETTHSATESVHELISAVESQMASKIREMTNFLADLEKKIKERKEKKGKDKKKKKKDKGKGKDKDKEKEEEDDD